MTGRETNRVDGRAGVRRQLEDRVEAHQARRVVTIRQYDDRAATPVLPVVSRQLRHLLQCDVHRVVEGRRSARRRLTNRVFKSLMVARETLSRLDPVVETNHRREVHWPNLSHEANGGL